MIGSLRRIAQLIVIASTLGGCATPYQPTGFTGGYEEVEIQPGVYFLEFTANAYTSLPTVVQYWHQRAKELCAAKGKVPEIINVTGGREIEFHKGTSVHKPAQTGHIRCVSPSSSGQVQMEHHIQALSQKLGGVSGSAEKHVLQDLDKEFVNNYRLRAERGDAEAQFNLGVMYEYGRGVPKDHAQAATWYRKAAEQGQADAQALMSVAYLSGLGVPRDTAQAVAWAQKAAEQDHAGGQYMLGQMYLIGEGVPQDLTKAVEWTRKAAEKGHATSQGTLGEMYENGTGVPKDTVQALAWYRKAAEQGQADAQAILAWRHYLGKGVPEDKTQAAAWARKAAEHGETGAQVLLGELYYYGTGVPQDYVLAYKWLSLAATQGNKKVIEFRDMTAKLLSPAQVVEAQGLAREWTERFSARKAFIETLRPLELMPEERLKLCRMFADSEAPECKELTKQ